MARKRKTKPRRTRRVFGLLANAGLVLFLLVLLLALGGALTRMAGLWGGGLGDPGSTHEHTDFKVYLLGEPVDFSQSQYQVRSPYIHVESGVGDLIHKHAVGATLGLFFQSMGITFNDQCFIRETGQRFCNDGQNTLKMLVNGQVSTRFGKYELRQGDRILISYGPESVDQLAKQLATVTNLAAGEGR